MSITIYYASYNQSMLQSYQAKERILSKLIMKTQNEENIKDYQLDKEKSSRKGKIAWRYFENQLREKIGQQKEAKKWNTTHQIYFLMFWGEKIIEDPMKNYSFDLPLNRCHYFKKMSTYFMHNLGPAWSKTPQQCKAKFSSIRRQIRSHKRKLIKASQYSFVDYIIDRGIQLQGISNELDEKISQLEILNNTDSTFMVHIKEIMKFDQSEQVLTKNSEIQAYLTDLA